MCLSFIEYWTRIMHHGPYHAGPTLWNSLPDNVISAPSLSTFRQRLKTSLFRASLPDIIIDPHLIIPLALVDSELILLFGQL